MTVALTDSPNPANGGGHSVKNLAPVDGFGTLVVHVGSDANPHSGAIIPPISLSTTFKQDGVGNHKGFEYARLGNPNRDALETMLATVEAGGACGIAFSSGSAATATILLAMGPHAHILSVNDIYGGFHIAKEIAAEIQMLEVSFLDLDNADDDVILAAFRPNTKLVWIESPTNPTLRLMDIPRIVSLARSHPSRPLVLVDNTFLSPFYQSPLLLGADIVVYSLTKYINGHADVTMGAVILPAHHAALARKLRVLQSMHGAVPSPFDCWLAHRGAKTLHLRMKAHGINALRVAQALERSPLVEEVLYPGLASHPGNVIAYRQLAPHAKNFVDRFLAGEPGDGHGDEAGFPYGGVVSFRIRGGAAEADAFVAATRLFVLAGSLGGTESLSVLPARMTHMYLSEAERAELCIGENLIRLSCGVEESEDLVSDVERALELAAGAGAGVVRGEGDKVTHGSSTRQGGERDYRWRTTWE